MQIIDLSVAVDAKAWEPDPVVHDVMTPADGACHMAQEMREYGLDIDPADLPDGELLSIDTITMTSHTGTHVDAPSHYGTHATYTKAPPRTIDEMPLENFFTEALCLDLAHKPLKSDISIEDL